MAMTKGDYEDQGERAARNDAKANVITQAGFTPGSWQQRHWQIGYDRVMAMRATQTTALPSGRALQGGPDIQNMPRALYHNSTTGVISSRPQSDISKLRVVLMGPFLANASDWPQAAREHGRLLAEMHNGEGYLPRRARLHRALLRLTMRHQGLRKLTAVQCLGIVPMGMGSRALALETAPFVGSA